MRLLPLAEALSSLSAVQEEEDPVSLRTEAVLVLSGASSSQRSDGDGDGGGRAGRTRTPPPTAGWISDGLGLWLLPLLIDSVDRQCELCELSSRFEDIECRMDNTDFRRRGLYEGASL